MTTIKTTCAACGDVELGPKDLALELDVSGDSGTYRFECPTCLTVQRRPANSRVVNVLLATGVEYEIIDSSPITEQEILEFAAALATELDPVRLLAS